MWTDFSIPAFLYEEGSFGVFVLVTVILGGGAAALSGRAVASTWRPWWQVAVYMLILACAVRFLHFSLFGGTLLSLHYYSVDAAVCLIAGYAGFRAERVRQMVSQYRWINDRSGAMRWRRRSPWSWILEWFAWQSGALAGCWVLLQVPLPLAW